MLMGLLPVVAAVGLMLGMPGIALAEEAGGGGGYTRASQAGATA